jgi:hypothetical protein
METNYGSLGDQIAHLTELTEENNRILKAIQRDKWIGFFLNLAVWGVILYGSYYLTMELVGPILRQMEALQGEAGSFDIGALLEQYERALRQ